MDLSITPGKMSHVLWRLGVVERWQRWFVNHPPRPERPLPATTSLRLQS